MNTHIHLFMLLFNPLFPCIPTQPSIISNTHTHILCPNCLLDSDPLEWQQRVDQTGIQVTEVSSGDLLVGIHPLQLLLEGRENSLWEGHQSNLWTHGSHCRNYTRSCIYNWIIPLFKAKFLEINCTSSW